MTTILAIETSTEMASAALLIGERVIQRELSGVQTHSQGILPMVQDLLSEAGIPLARCDAIGFGCGPGAFTGVRTACGIVQGLAYGAGLPVLPIVTLQAMAEGARRGHGVTDALCVLDARMEEFYWAHYRFSADAWEELGAPQLSRVPVLPPSGPASPTLVFGKGVDLGELPAGVKQVTCVPDASQVAWLAVRDYVAGKAVPAEMAQPLYLRNKVALTTEEREQQRRLQAAGKDAA
jgi:tRNA threonylcarbamoyladenosine biosynthesis protein TsaB